MKPILLLDETLIVEVFYACEDADLVDNICLKVVEDCAEEEKVFRHEESHLLQSGNPALLSKGRGRAPRPLRG